MDNDGPPFVDFKCTHCRTLLCKTDGESVRLHVTSSHGVVYESQYANTRFRRLDFICPQCGHTRIWKRVYDRRREERKDKRQH